MPVFTILFLADGELVWLMDMFPHLENRLSNWCMLCLQVLLLFCWCLSGEAVWQVGVHCFYRSFLASWYTLCLQVCSGKLVYIVFTGLFWLVEDHWPLDVCHGLKSASGWWRTDLADWCIVCTGLLLADGELIWLIDVYCLRVCFLLVEEWCGQLMQITCTDLLLGDGELIDVYCL